MTNRDEAETQVFYPQNGGRGDYQDDYHDGRGYDGGEYRYQDQGYSSGPGAQPDYQRDMYRPERGNSRLPVVEDIRVDTDHSQADREAVQDMIARTYEARVKTASKVSDEVFTDPNTGKKFDPALSTDEKKAVVKSARDTEGDSWGDQLESSMVSTMEFVQMRSRLSNGVGAALEGTAQDQAQDAVLRKKLAGHYDAARSQLFDERNKSDDLQLHLENEQDAHAETEAQRKNWQIGAIVAGVVAAVCLVGWIWTGVHNSSDDVDPEDLSDNPEVAEVQKQVVGKDNQIKDLQEKLDKANSSLKTLQDSSGDSGKAVKEMQGKLDGANKRADKAEDALSNAQSDAKRDAQNREDRISDLERQLDNATGQTTTVTKTVTQGAGDGGSQNSGEEPDNDSGLMDRLRDNL